MASDEQPPFVDYCRLQQGAEESASSFVDALLKSGGAVLYDKYLRNKAFVFAQETVADHVISHLEMGFVAHDPGERPLQDVDEASGERPQRWDLEDEPVPKEIDSWARMHLPQRRRGDDDGLPSSQARRMKRIQTIRGVRNSDAKTRSRAESAPKRSENRMFSLPEELQLDDEEERLREQKAQEKAKMIEKARKADEAEKAEEQERARVQALHEEMSRRPHTFDNEGVIIWIEEPKPDRLPKVQETFPYNIKRDPRKPTGEDTLTRTQLSSSQGFGSSQGLKAAEVKAQQKAKKRDKKARSSKLDDAEFTDFFSKLQHGQPPILETMSVRPGVTLESNGRKKDGPPQEKSRQMSRKEYVQLAEHELNEGHDDGGEKGRDNGGGEGGPPPAPDGGGERGEDGGSATGGGDGGEEGGIEGVSLPAIGGTRGALRFAGGATRGVGQSGAAADGAGGEARVKGEVQMAPAAPPHFSMRSKFEAIGHLRPPRYHQAALGGPYSSTGSAQPPIGATMGHGLFQGSQKENFFYPSPNANPPLSPLMRSASEGFLKKERSVTTPSTELRASPPGSRQQLSREAVDAPPSRGGSRNTSRIVDSAGLLVDNFPPREDGGFIKAEKGQAYSKILHLLTADQRAGHV